MGEMHRQKLNVRDEETEDRCDEMHKTREKFERDARNS